MNLSRIFPTAIALCLCASSARAGLTLFSTGFEDYDNSMGYLNQRPGWTGLGSGTNQIGNNSAHARTGSRLAEATVIPNTELTALKRTLIAGQELIDNPVVQAGCGLRLQSQQGSSQYIGDSLTMVDSFGHTVADTGIIYDISNTRGFGTRHLIIYADWFDSTTALAPHVIQHDLGLVNATAIQTYDFGSINKYLDVAISLNFLTGEIIFNNNLFGEESTHGQMAVGSQPGAFSDVQDVGFKFYGSGYVTADDLYYQAVPEPTLAFVVTAFAPLIKRPRR